MDTGHFVRLPAATAPERPQPAEGEPPTHDVADLDAGRHVRVAHVERLQLECADQGCLSHTRASQLAGCLLRDGASSPSRSAATTAA